MKDMKGVKDMKRTSVTVASCGLSLFFSMTFIFFTAFMPREITLRGCIERDAATSTPVYKLVTSPPDTKVYRLSAPKEIDIAAHVGHTVDVTGDITPGPPGGAANREAQFTVTRLLMVKDSCSIPSTLSAAARD